MRTPSELHFSLSEYQQRLDALRIRMQQREVVGDKSNGPEGASVEVACISPNGWVWSTPAGTGAISVAAYLKELGDLGSGESLETVTPSGNRFRCSVDDERATVEATFEIVSLITMVKGG